MVFLRSSCADSSKLRVLCQGANEVAFIHIRVPTGERELAPVERQDFLGELLDIRPTFGTVDDEKFAADIFANSVAEDGDFFGIDECFHVGILSTKLHVVKQFCNLAQAI